MARGRSAARSRRGVPAHIAASASGPQAGSLQGIIDARLEAFPKLSAKRLFDEVCAAGYPGGYSRVNDYVRATRPREPVDAPVRFETPAGRQGQVDFGTFTLHWGRRHALVIVLGYSRLLWLRFYPRQTMAVLTEAVESGFDRFGGVPEELLFDPMRAVVLSDDRAAGGGLVLNAEFLRFAAHWGLLPRSCRPYRAKTKGKVERPIRYIRESFFYGRSFANDDDLNEQAARWLEGTAKYPLAPAERSRSSWPVLTQLWIVRRFTPNRLDNSPSKRPVPNSTSATS